MWSVLCKDLFDKHYVADFGVGLTDAKDYHPAEIACAKRETDTARADNPRAPFVISDACRGVTFHTPPPAEVEAGPATSEPKTNTLLDALAAEGHCSKFLAAVEKVNLTGTLKTGGPWTVLAPTNHAIGNMPGGFDALMKKPDQLKRFVRAHLVDGIRPSSEIKPGGVRWPTADGRNVIVEKKGQITLDKTSHVIKAEIPADNGLIYTIDRVLVPSQAAGN